MNSRFKIQVKVGENIRWADADKVFAHLMERYMKKIPPGEKPKPYKEKVENFYAGIDTDWVKLLQEAYPNVDTDAELNRAKMWLLSNTPKRNLKKFVNNWMAKAMGEKKNQQQPVDGRTVHEIYKSPPMPDDAPTQEELQEILNYNNKKG